MQQSMPVTGNRVIWMQQNSPSDAQSTVQVISPKLKLNTVFYTGNFVRKQTYPENIYNGSGNIYKGTRNIYKGTENIYKRTGNIYKGTENIYKGAENIPLCLSNIFVLS